MSQEHESRNSTNQYISKAWQTRNITDGSYLSTPDGAWDIIVFVDEHGAKQAAIAGQATRPMTVPYRANTSSVVVSFDPSVYAPHYPADQIRDRLELLQTVDREYFIFASHKFKFPGFFDVEEVIDEMIALGLLRDDHIVQGELDGDRSEIPSRTIQRHFIKTTGITQKHISQIKRAQKAIAILKSGRPTIEAAAESGYYDQSHMSKSLKKLMNIDSVEIDDIHKL